MVDSPSRGPILRGSRTGVGRSSRTHAPLPVASGMRQVISAGIMFAVIRTGGKQYKVAKHDVISVERLAAEPGATIELGEVLMIGEGAGGGEGGGRAPAPPFLGGAAASPPVVKQTGPAKIIVFKKKRRHNYRRKKGH